MSENLLVTKRARWDTKTSNFPISVKTAKFDLGAINMINYDSRDGCKADFNQKLHCIGFRDVKIFQDVQNGLCIVSIWPVTGIELSGSLYFL